MPTALLAGSLYFAVVFAVGFALGVARTLLLAPLTGAAVAVLLELPLILLASWVACGRVIRRLAVPPSLAARLTMGFSALLLLIGAEALVSMLLAGRSLSAHLALYGTLPVRIGLVGQLVFAAFPTIYHSRK